MSLTINQSWYDITQSTQWQVNFGCLFHTITCCTCFTCTLWTRQIDQVQLWCFIFLISFFILLLRINVNTENTMRSWWLCVHICSSCCSVFKTHIHVLLHFGNWVDLNLCKIFDEDTFIRTLLEIHSGFGIFS